MFALKIIFGFGGSMSFNFDGSVNALGPLA